MKAEQKHQYLKQTAFCALKNESGFASDNRYEATEKWDKLSPFEGGTP